MDLGPKIDVAESRNEHARDSCVTTGTRARNEAPAGAGRFCLRGLRTKLSPIVFITLKRDRRVINENIADVAG